MPCQGLGIRVPDNKRERHGKAALQAGDERVVVGVNIRVPYELVGAGLRMVAQPLTGQIRDALVLETATRKLVPVGPGIA